MPSLAPSDPPSRSDEVDNQFRHLSYKLDELIGIVSQLNGDEGVSKLTKLTDKLDDLDTKLTDKLEDLDTKLEDLDTELTDKLDNLDNRLDDLDTTLTDKLEDLDQKISGKMIVLCIVTAGILWLVLRRL